METEEIVKEFKETNKRVLEQIEKLKFQLEMSKGCLFSHNYVVKVGAYTISSKWNEEIGANTLDYENSFGEYHSVAKWNKNGVEEIKKQLLEAGEDREIEVYFYKDFYKKKIQQLKNLVETNSKIIKQFSK